MNKGIVDNQFQNIRRSDEIIKKRIQNKFNHQMLTSMQNTENSIV
jgi:hypothetical protein